MTGRPFIISELIIKSIKSELSYQEESILRQWRESSERNEKLYQKCIANTTDEEFLTNYLADIDYMPYYQECCRLIDEKKRHQKLHKSLFKNIWRVAAMLMIPLVVSTMLLLNEGGSLFKRINLWVKESNSLTSNSTITPGGPNAILILAGGERITLGRDSEKPVDKPENITIEEDNLKYSRIEQKEREYNTIIVPRGGEFLIQLSDGTKVWLNAESELRYPVSFGDGERGVYLAGEAYFEVVKSDKHPFTITSGDHRITVLGTEFCVRAYKDEHKILTTLESGRVSINSGNESVQLHPGEQSIVEGAAIKIERVNTQLYTAWRNKMFVFEEQTLEEMLRTLSRWYDMEVVFKEKELKEYRFTGELMKYSNIEEFFKKLEELEKVSFKINGHVINVAKYTKQ